MCSLEGKLEGNLDRNAKGNIAEAAVVFHAARLGVQAFRPLLEHGRYDMVLEIGAQLLRVQCKWARRHGDALVVGLEGSRHTPAGYVRTRYLEGEIDAVAAYSAELDRCYLIPAPVVINKSAIRLRLAPPKNGQRAGLNWAGRFELDRVVADASAQAGTTAESQDHGSGEEPREPAQPSVVVGAHEFRNRFGYYMELAEAGTPIEITRRNKLSLRLVTARH